MYRKIVAINTRFLLYNNLEGVGSFTHETLRRITVQNKDIQFIFIFDRPYHSSFIYSSNIIPIVVFPPSRHPILWYIWFEKMIPYALKKYNPDVFVSLDGYNSLNFKGKSVLVMHDLAFEHYPHHLPYLQQKYYRHFSLKYAQKATNIATVSEFTKNDIVQKYNISPSKIQVIYNGANTEIFVPLNFDEKISVKNKYSTGCDYFLFVGAIHPRKNLLNILRAFEAFKQRTTTNVKLLVVGRMAWKQNNTIHYYQQMTYKNDVIFLGHLQKNDLAKLMAAAEALVFVSLFEGFGIPLIEAMATQTPIITSNTSSMPEIAGNAAIIVNPNVPKQITQAMQLLYQNTTLQNQLVINGLQQQKKFNWQNTADGLWNAIEQVL